MARQSSMQCSYAGAKGRVDGLKFDKRSQHPLNGAVVAVVTNRFGGLLVELVNSHGPYRSGERVVIGPNNFGPL